MTAASRPTALRSDARLLPVLVRLVEGAALVLLLSAAHELWSAWQNAGVDGFLGRGPVLLDRVWSVVHNQSRGPVAVVVSAVLLAGCLAAAWWAGEEREATTGTPGWMSVRREVAALTVTGLVLALANVLVVAVAAALHYGPDLGPSPLVPGEDGLTTLLPLAAWPLAGVLLYAALGCLWWLLRPVPSEVAAVGVVASDPAPGAVVPDEDEDGPGEAQVVEVVEVVAEEGVRRLSSDGSTTNGYEEFFRRS